MPMHVLLDESRTEAIGQQYSDENKHATRRSRSRERGASSRSARRLGKASTSPLESPFLPGRAAAVAIPLDVETLGSAGETVMGTQTIDWLQENQ